MKTIIGAVLALLFLEPPWTWIVIGILAAIDLFEILVWLKWRKKRSTTGEEGLVGAHGVAITDLAPEGQIKLRGTIWKARASAPIGPGDEVIVTATEGMTLQVERSGA